MPEYEKRSKTGVAYLYCGPLAKTWLVADGRRNVKLKADTDTGRLPSWSQSSRLGRLYPMTPDSLRDEVQSARERRRRGFPEHQWNHVLP